MISQENSNCSNYQIRSFTMMNHSKRSKASFHRRKTIYITWVRKIISTNRTRKFQANWDSIIWPEIHLYEKRVPNQISNISEDTYPWDHLKFKRDKSCHSEDTTRSWFKAINAPLVDFKLLVIECSILYQISKISLKNAITQLKLIIYLT